MSAIPKRKYTVEEYLQMEQTAPYKSEFYNGEIFPMGEIEGDTPEAMAGAMPVHNLVFKNVLYCLENKLRGKGYIPFGGDQRIYIPETGMYTYPDISVFCGPLQYEDNMTLKNPVLIVEILSKTTEGYNRGSKFEMYRSIPTLVEYLMIDSQRLHVELFRKEVAKWVLVTETNKLQDVVELITVADTFPLTDLYYGTEEMMKQQEFQIR
jgi:Uma2 family endonuclease